MRLSSNPSHRWLRRLSVAFLLAVVGAGLGVGFAQWRVGAMAEGRVTDQLARLPDQRVALVLGCSKSLADGRPNRFFVTRMNAAADLFRAGKVEYLLVSGDNSVAHYDESSDMRDALVARGVPVERVVCDFAGFSTLDSVLRAREIFGQEAFLVVSQDFHAERAVFLGRAHGMEVDGYAAEEVGGAGGRRTRWRESLARVKAVMDVMLDRQPRYLGSPVPIGT